MKHQQKTGYLLISQWNASFSRVGVTYCGEPTQHLLAISQGRQHIHRPARVPSWHCPLLEIVMLVLALLASQGTLTTVT